MGARSSPIAEPTPALTGTSTRLMPSFSARRAACSGAAPPNAMSVRGCRSFPLSRAGTRGLRLRLVDEADLSGRPAHVERHDLIAPMLARDASGEYRAACRAGFDQPHGKADRSVGGRDSPARGHQEQGAVKARTH